MKTVPNGLLSCRKKYSHTSKKSAKNISAKNSYKWKICFETLPSLYTCAYPLTHHVFSKQLGENGDGHGESWQGNDFFIGVAAVADGEQRFAWSL